MVVDHDADRLLLHLLLAVAHLLTSSQSSSCDRNVFVRDVIETIATNARDAAQHKPASPTRSPPTRSP